jgi:apolipoprotein N-acyltransferase
MMRDAPQSGVNSRAGAPSSVRYASPVRARLEQLADPSGRFHGWPAFAITFTGSLALALGSPRDGLTVLIWLGFFPLALVARVASGLRPRRLFALGWVGGLCVGLVGFPWIAEMLERFAGFPTWLALIGLLAFSAWTALPFGLWMVGTALGPRGGWKGLAWPTVLWVAIAAVWPALFPYTVVIGFAEAPAWMQAAELGGVALVEAQVVLCGVLLADAMLSEHPRARWGRALVALALPVVSHLVGAARMATLDAAAEGAPQVRFGIVQPNVPLMSIDRVDKMHRLRGQSRLARDEGAEVIVWPEAGAFPFRVIRPFTRDFRDPLRRVLQEHELPTIFGAASLDPNHKWEYNTVFVMSPDGRVTDFFDKVILVPFGEYIPIVDPEWAMGIIPGMSHNLAGDGPARFVVDVPATADAASAKTFAAGPLICYEDIFADFSRSVATQTGGIEVFVNVTIDTWFGVTAEPWEHLALAQFRSVEHRIPMVRSVAAGPSSVVDHTGRLTHALELRGPTRRNSVPPERLVADVALVRNTAENPTIYARGGWLLPWGCAVVVAGVVLVRIRRSTYRPNASRSAAPRERSDSRAS